MKFYSLKKIKKKIKGFSVTELIVAIGVFTVGFSAVSFFAIDSLRIYQNTKTRVNATLLVQEVANAIVINKSYLWSSIVENSDGENKRIELNGQEYNISNGNITKDGITISFTINTAERDGTGDLTESGTPDVHTRIVSVSASWTDIVGKLNTLNYEVFLNDWNVPFWRETDNSDFETGTPNDTLVQAVVGDGEVILASKVYADWCTPELTVTDYDLPGQGIANSIYAIPGQVGIGTGENASGISFMKSNITDDDPPVVINEATFDGYKVNDVFIEDDYAYLATDDNAKEVVILDISSTPYQEVGYFDGPTSQDGYAIRVVGNYGFLVQNNALRVFDVSSKTGARPSVKNLTLFNTGIKLQIQGNYAYILIRNDVQELQIVDISNPLNPVSAAAANVNTGVAISAMNIDEGANIAYLGSDNATNQRELFILDISNKSGQVPLIGQYDTNGMSIDDIVIVEDNTRALVVGDNAEEYQVVDIENPANPVRCGGLQFDSGANGIAAVAFTETNNKYSYVVTNDATSELKVVRGGETGGFVGNGYVTEGFFDSEVFDTGSSTTKYFYLDADYILPEGTGVQFQLRSGNSSDLSASQWYGPDGTSSTYFSEDTTFDIPSAVANGDRYIQYRVRMTSDASQTPVLEQVKIFYESE